MKNQLLSLKHPLDALQFWLSDWGGILTGALSVLFISYTGWIFLVHPSEEHKIVVTDVIQPIVSLAMTILALRASRQAQLDSATRRAWRIIGVSFLMYFVGNVTWAYYEILQGTAPDVSWADAAFLSYYPICLVGLLSFPMGRSGRSRLTFALDASTVMLGAAILIWYLVLRPVALAEHASSLEMVVTLAFPVGNTVLLFGVVAILLRRPIATLRGSLGILAAAVFFVAIADFGYAYQTLGNEYFGGQWPDCFYMLGFVMMAISAQFQIRRARISPAGQLDTGVPPAPFSWLPYAAVTGAYSLLLYVAFQFQHAHGSEPIVWLTVGAFLITLLVVIRQVVALRENVRLLAERSARQSESRFVSLVQHASDVIAILKPNGRLSYLSPSCERVFGYEPGDLIGKQLRELIHEEDRQRAVGVIELIRHEPGKTRSLELRVRHRNENWLYIEAIITNLLEEPSVAGIVVNSRNVTERKVAEEALRESEEKLRQSQKMEAIGQLAGGVAHDFNNLLAVIIGYSDMLLRRANATTDERIVKQVVEIRKAADRATSLTRQLLAFSRKQVLQPKVLDLNSVVGDMDKMLRRLIGEHIDMQLDLQAGLGSIKADPGQIEQVLLNLTVNARDAMPFGGVLTITTENVVVDAVSDDILKPGAYVMISVCDTGCGIDQKILPRIFEPFFTTKDQGKGTGLGLPTVYGIIQQSGGNIKVDSVVNEGTTFKVYLPRVNEAATSGVHLTESQSVTSATETLLLVEDEDAVRALVYEILKSSGYQVMHARDGLEAMAVSQHHTGIIDLMLTDVVMPNVGGRELAEKLSLTRPEMRVLYMSGYTDDAIVHHGVLDGATAFLEKPFTPEALIQKVREVLAA